MESMLLPVILLLVGFLLIVIELFVPSGGAIGAMSALCILAAIVLGFMIDIRQGFMLFLFTAVCVPLLLFGLFKIWPHTPIGRRIISQPPTADEVLPDDEHYQNLKDLVGKFGVAKTKMLPSGTVRIDNRTYDAVSDGMAVEEGQKIKVIAIRTNRIIVRPILTHEFDVHNQDDILAQSPDALGIENWDEPLGEARQQ